MKSHLTKVTMLTVTLLCLCVSCVFAQTGNAVVNWENDVLEGTGYGTPPDRAKNPGHARILAHQAAMLDGYRRLAEAAKGIHITAESTMSDNISTGDVVSGDVEAVVKRARVVFEDYDQDGNCTVKMEVPLYGVTAPSIAKIALKPVEREAFPTPSVNVSVNIDNTTITQSLNYTGLIVDCSGLGLNLVMSPVIKNADKQPIYGYKNLDYDKVIANGMASYANGLNGKVIRAGSNPLVVKAISVENHNSYPIISTEDANRILVANQTTHFLDNCSVVFVR